MRLVLAALLFLVAAPPSDRWDWSTADLSWAHDKGAEYADSRARCASVIHAEPPASDHPTAAEARALKGCDSEALYYGIGRPANPVLARKCAFIEKEDEGGEFSGRNMLMTIYANGKGAKRNIDVATHLACGIELAAPAEMEGRLPHLAALKAGEEFSICHDATSGYLIGWCALHEVRGLDLERDAELLAIARVGKFAGSADWAELKAALERYANAHGEDETDLRGTMRVAESLGAKSEVRNNFLAAMIALQGHKVPRATTAQLAATDAELNRNWKELLGELSEDETDGITKAGMRGAGRKWIAYRDKFLAFARVHYPAASQAGVAQLLTKHRIAELSDE